VLPGASEPYSAALVVQLAEAVGGVGGGLHGPVRRLGPGVVTPVCRNPSTSGPPRLDGAGEPLE
jgi:hypothetical protein